ncbi:histidine phosphatase family protein [Herbaspirillum sp. RTI4]|uniref:histidine phosphatase family protein n=1 Tax=Herbaspirillum sp. RTI4 TaxID=3048640 RepID=UPI002AB3959F|nr:histidine phosphatase family protein [Herbaspirillum sp. RTI4]MDY7577542.1 histidine phosphatase family protein [Herbaspirillum sp. RTI4]MEA9981017.1 histidine phosphatase family protein [Herbaspirillum sp. RTI4]
MTDILLIRHGETDWNVERRLQGFKDIPLNAQGQLQAERLALALRSEALDAIYCSDLERARQTAVALANPHGIVPQIDPALRERCFGAFEGLQHADIETLYPQQYAAWQRRDLDARYPDGDQPAETLRDFMTRSVAAVTRLAAMEHRGQREQHERRCIAIVTHGGVLECLHRAATGASIATVRDFEIFNASINRFHWDGVALHLKNWGDVAHLPQAALDETVR